MFFLRVPIVSVALVWATATTSVIAAPVLWSTRPSSIAPGSGITASDDAQALDALTAPLSADQMGLGSGIDFRTTFDEEIKALGRARQEQLDPADGEGEDKASDPLDPRVQGPNLRYLPRLRNEPLSGSGTD